MSSKPAEFSRSFPLDRIGQLGDIHIVAEAQEREALARRFGFEAIDQLEASCRLSIEENAADGGKSGPVVILARGHIIAALSQACVATGEAVPERIEEAFAIRFVPETDDGEEEIELTAEDCDIVSYSDGAIDLGEAVAETLALVVDPYPRAPGAEEYLRDMGVKREEDMSPFAALKGLMKE